MEIDRRLSAVLGAEGVARLHIGADIGAAEAIDRLLGVADQEERARPDSELGPVVVAHRPAVAAQPPEDLGLQRDRCPGTHRRGRARSAAASARRHRRHGRAADRARRKSDRRSRAGRLERL